MRFLEDVFSQGSLVIFNLSVCTMVSGYLTKLACIYLFFTQPKAMTLSAQRTLKSLLEDHNIKDQAYLGLLFSLET